MINKLDKAHNHKYKVIAKGEIERSGDGIGYQSIYLECKCGKTRELLIEK